MQLRSDIQLSSALKALKDVVLPAIDPANRLALEQAHLVMGMLGLMQQQLPLQYRFDRDELERLTGTLAVVQAATSDDAALSAETAHLRELCEAAEHVLQGARVEPAELLDAVRALRAQLSHAVTVVQAQARPDVRQRVERAVLALSREQLLRERALMAPQGWEPDPAALPSIHSLLASGEHSATPSRENA